MSALVARIDATAGDPGRIGNLVNYMESPGLTNANERVIYREVGNMLSTEAHDIIQEMRDTADAAKAKDGRASNDPFEHFVISFTQGDAVTNADWKRAIQIALKHLGYENHQYFATAHSDTDNLHLHLAVSRIDPETLQAKALPFAVKQAEMIGARINHEFGMEPMENNRYFVNERGDVERKQVEAVKQPDKLRDIIEQSRSWGEFHERTRAIGINYERKGSGALINGEKASDVDRAASLAKLVKRFGEYQPPATPETPKEKIYAIPTNHNIENSQRRENTPSDRVRKLSERRMAEVKGWKSSGLLQDNVQPDRPKLYELRRSDASRRAAERALARERLADQQRKERTAIYQDFKEKKADVWADKKTPQKLRSGVLSVLAAEQAKALADLRDKQKRERDAFRNLLNEKKPLLKQQEQERTITGQTVEPVEHKDIRAYKHYIDNDSKTVIYSKGDTEQAAFIDRGQKISFVTTDNESLLAGLQLAQVKFGKSLTLTGDDEFKTKALKIAVANGITIANPELQAQIQAERERLAKEREAMRVTKYEALDAFKQLADAVPADRWRVTLGSYVEVTGKDGKPFLPTTVLRDDSAPPLTSTSAGKGNDGLSVDQVAQRWGYIEQSQRDITKARVILTPASDTLHIVHIDDVSSDALARLKKDGYTMAAVIRTSDDKRNVILTCPKDPALTPRQQHEVQKQLSQALNKKYGDPEARNAMQPFRAPMFRNLKPKYKGDGDDYPTITLEHCQRGDCKKLHKMAKGIPIGFGDAEAALLKEREPVKRDVVTVPETAMMETRAYLAHVASIRKDGEAGKLKLRRRDDGTFDQSAIDVLAAQRMRMTGHTQTQIVAGVTNGCNQVRAANGDRPKANPLEFGHFAADTAAKINIEPLKHQVKYRIADERAAGVVSPVVQAREAELRQAKIEMIRQSTERARATEREANRGKGHGR